MPSAVAIHFRSGSELKTMGTSRPWHDSVVSRVGVEWGRSKRNTINERWYAQIFHANRKLTRNNHNKRYQETITSTSPETSPRFASTDSAPAQLDIPVCHGDPKWQGHDLDGGRDCSLRGSRCSLWGVRSVLYSNYTVVFLHTTIYIFLLIGHTTLIHRECIVEVLLWTRRESSLEWYIKPLSDIAWYWHLKECVLYITSWLSVSFGVTMLHWCSANAATNWWKKTWGPRTVEGGESCLNLYVVASKRLQHRLTAPRDGTIFFSLHVLAFPGSLPVCIPKKTSARHENKLPWVSQELCFQSATASTHSHSSVNSQAAESLLGTFQHLRRQDIQCVVIIVQNGINFQPACLNWMNYDTLDSTFSEEHQAHGA